MRNKIVDSLEAFNDYVRSVHRAAAFFLRMNDAPEIAKDARASVSAFIGKPCLDLTYRDATSFVRDTNAIREWLNHIACKRESNSTFESRTFEEEEFIITLRLWTFQNDN